MLEIGLVFEVVGSLGIGLVTTVETCHSGLFESYGSVGVGIRQFDGQTEIHHAPPLNIIASSSPPF